MTHLTDGQFEDAVQGKAAEPAHVAECQACRDRLAERRAVRGRLQSAFGSVHAGRALAERIGRSVAESRPPSRIHHLSRRAWATLGAAAAVLVLAIPALMYFGTPNSAVAAQMELARIHERNLTAHHEFYSDADPAKIADYLKTQLGFEPATPRLGQGMAMRGCCVAYFRGQAVGSYVVETPRGPISIIVVPQTPTDLGMTETFESGGKTLWIGAFARNSMVAFRLGGYTYCAVGEVPNDLLTPILLDLGL
jgi:glycosyltransferase A (GT-A) superfamily protein (DUF2064 family)